jgi:hypothetical protein
VGACIALTLDICGRFNIEPKFYHRFPALLLGGDGYLPLELPRG